MDGFFAYFPSAAALDLYLIHICVVLYHGVVRHVAEHQLIACFERLREGIIPDNIARQARRPAQAIGVLSLIHI